ncbi:heat shock protein 30-like [Solea solea]|uniref:heat shock protein 30-like n=1 Tax=Solea solea TaxID=90069 RepID=UPI00272B092B|nr:heat shock protein 30-like [Solea solea]
MTGKFLKTLELLQLEYKSVDSPTAETEDNTRRTDTLTVFHLTTRRINSKPTLKMLCSRGSQSGLSPLMLVHWPVRSLWPEVRPQLYQQHLLQRHLQELCSSLELMDTLQQQILEEEEKKKKSVQSSETMQPVSFQLEKHGDNFGLILNTEGFSPEELSVRQVGRKLRVSGKTEKKQEDGNGSYSYRLQEFRQEFDLPQGVNPEAVTCCLSPDGKLHIQAARAPCAEEAERELSIQRSTEEKTQQSESSHTEDNNSSSSSSS